jgi:hypothetical protein
VELVLTEEETEVLKAMVEKDIRGLLMEIADTDSRHFREELKLEEELLNGIRVKLASAVPLSS